MKRKISKTALALNEESLIRMVPSSEVKRIVGAESWPRSLCISYSVCTVGCPTWG